MSYRTKFGKTWLITVAVGLMAGMTEAQVPQAEESAPPYQQPARQTPPSAAQPAQSGQDGRNVAAQMMEIRSQLEMISRQLSAIQEQAMRMQSVAEAIDEYESRLESKMKDVAPEMKAEIDERSQLAEELRSLDASTLQGNQEDPALQSKIARYQELAQQLQPVEQRASADPEVISARQVAAGEVQEKMQEVDPRAGELLEQRDMLSHQYQTLQQRQMQEQMRQPQNP